MHERYRDYLCKFELGTSSHCPKYDGARILRQSKICRREKEWNQNILGKETLHVRMIGIQSTFYC